MSNAMQVWRGGSRSDDDNSLSVCYPVLCRGSLEVGVVTMVIPGLSSIQCYAAVAWRLEE